MKKLFFTLLVGLNLLAANANNIVVSNVTLSNQLLSSQSIDISFNVAWENSWRVTTNQNNYDGAWLFVKFRKNGTLLWSHCHVTELSTPADAILDGTDDEMGVFIYRSSYHIGSVEYNDVQLRWNYANDGVLDTDNVEIEVFALEMVYIPEGAYYLGSGGNENNCFKQGSTSAPYLVSSAGIIPTGTSGNTLNFNGMGTAPDNEIPATFPNGYGAYWIMKYETSQQQYADFLNHLTLQQATTLKLSNTEIFGSTAWPNFIPIAPEQANRYTNARETYALADWSGLRPLSEMEFEKACRGANTPVVANEYSWGSTGFTNLTSVSNPLTAEESINLPSTANALIGGNINRPVRVGIFARTTGSTRVLSGASYYGVMNLSDNVYEPVIYSGNANGLSVNKNTHGDGLLNADGTSSVDPAWAIDAFGLKGSFYDGSTDRARVSDRYLANVYNGGSSDHKGIRLVRTAP